MPGFKLNSGNLDKIEAPVECRKNWTTVESLALINAFGERKSSYEDPKITKKAFWKDLCKSLEIDFTPDQCKGRWKTMLQGWKKVEDCNRVSGNSAKKYEFGDEISKAVDGKVNVTPIHLLESSKPASRVKNTFSREIFNGEQSDEERPSTSSDLPPNKKIRKVTIKILNTELTTFPKLKVYFYFYFQTLNKKSDMLDWMETTRKLDVENRKQAEEREERRHQENLGFMKDFLGVLKELVPKQN
jgi:Myb/SANT-like DNA-binding domain